MRKIKKFLLVLVLSALIPFIVLAQWDPLMAELETKSQLPLGMTIYLTIENLMQWILGIFGFIAVIGFVISGIQYLTSAGNENAIETAKRNMKWSIVGVIVGLGGLVIIWAINNALYGISEF